ncbi:ABC transporter ATP-binding protein [Aerococcaceae bacterium WGS1372]
MKNLSQNKQRKTNFSLKEQWEILKYLFHFARSEFQWFALSIIMMIIASTLSAYLPIIIQQYIDHYLMTQSATMAITLRVALTYLFLLLIRMVIVYIKDYSFKLASEYTVAKMRNNIYHKLGNLSLDYFNKVPNGEVVSRVTNDTETIKEFWNVFLTFFDGFINAFTIGVAMFSLNAEMSWIFMAFVPVILALIYIYQKVSTVIYRRMRRALSNVNAQLSESTMGMWLIQQFNQTERMKEEFDKVNQEYLVARTNMFKMNALLLMPAINLIEQVVLVIVIWVFASQLLNGSLVDIGLIYAFTTYSKSFFHPIGSMLDSLSIYQDGLVAASRGMDLLANDDLAPQQLANSQHNEVDGDIDINDLYFSYDGVHDVLKDINIDVNSGEMIAIVGHTGSGKSTIINLLMRFYDFNRGTIDLNHENIKNYSKGSLRQQIGLVQQDAFMFYGDVLDNIRLHGDYTDEEVIKAAEFTGASHFIETMEKGYHTHISEGGSSLSAGQKQLINIARTVLRNPRVLILDEATANIDTETEQYIQQSLEKIREQSTLIVIAHRLSTIKNADKIYVLHKGRVIEQGHHDELIALEGTYYDMYQLQTLQEQSQ